MSERRCECGCGERLPANASAQMRHRPGHRQRKYQRKRDAEVREALAAVGGGAGVKMTPTGAPTGSRRPSRDGLGTRIYLTPSEVADLLDQRVPASVYRKAARAEVRLRGAT